MIRDTPISRHLKSVAAARVANGGAAASAQRQQTRAQDLMRMRLATDQQRLKDTRSIARKIEIKREILPDYAPYIEQVLQADAGGQDDVLATLMVWAIDAGDLHSALDIARYAIRHGLSMPATFERTLPATFAEGFGDASCVDADTLAEVIVLTDPFDMVDQIRAKLYKAYGVAIERQGRPAVALEALRRALALDSRIGVKRDIARLEAALGERSGESDRHQGDADA